MRFQNRKHDRCAYQNATSTAKRIARLTMRYAACLENDPERKERIAACVCPVCYYSPRGRIGGASVTGWECGGCGELHYAGTTATDVLCQKCAADRGCCKECGGDLNLRMRRKLSFD